MKEPWTTKSAKERVQGQGNLDQQEKVSSIKVLQSMCLLVFETLELSAINVTIAR
jgi:hypothetical protein